MGVTLVAAGGLLTAVPSLAVEHTLEYVGSVLVAHELSCSPACGIFFD